MDRMPVCFGRWALESSNKCEHCTNQIECYNRMRENEKRQEAEERVRNTPWYKRNTCSEKTLGICEKCG